MSNSNLVKINHELIVDTDKICFMEPLGNKCRINFNGGSSILITKKEYDVLLDYIKVRVYAVIFELREHIEICSMFFSKNILISTWSTYAKAVAARDELRKYYKGDKEQISVSLQFVNGR